jgi:glycerol-3-phosphate acyltransferase PlsX
VTINGEKGPFTVIDVGANPQPKALHLLQYALMGSAYVHDALGIAQPRVGLMNIGSEDKKGHPLVREARELLRGTPANFSFVGNVEGVDVFAGKCDVIVSDGFTGNVMLKVSEGCAEYMLRAMGRLMAEAGVDEDKRRAVVGRMLRDVDYSEYGGALLLGVEGIVTICHGRSNGPAICNAIGFALKAVGAKVNEHIVAAARAASAGR